MGFIYINEKDQFNRFLSGLQKSKNFMTIGWHFSFLSENEENVHLKFKSFSHSFQNMDVINNTAQSAVQKLRNVLIKEKVVVDDSYPCYITTNIEYFKKYIEE